MVGFVGESERERERGRERQHATGPHVKHESFTVSEVTCALVHVADGGCELGVELVFKAPALFHPKVEILHLYLADYSVLESQLPHKIVNVLFTTTN